MIRFRAGRVVVAAAMVVLGGAALSNTTGRVADAAPGDVATFSGFPIGTVITTQYRSHGLDFSASRVFISNDSSNLTAPVVSGTPQFVGPIEFSVVDPSTGAPTTAQGFKLDVGYINNRNSVRVSAYGSDRSQLYTTRINGLGINTVNVTINGIARVVVEQVATELAGFAVDNVSLRTNVVGITPRTMASLGDSYSSGEGLIPNEGLDYDCGTDLEKGTYAENTTGPVVGAALWNPFRNHVSWPSNACETLTQSRDRPSDLQERPRKDYENKCHRHGDAYPNAIREDLGIDARQAVFVACSGATTDHVLNNGKWAGTTPAGIAGGESQLKNTSDFALRVNDSSPDLITIGIGGNDAGFEELLLTCLKEDCLNIAGFSDDTLKRIDTDVYPALVTTFQRLKTRFPDSTIAAFGYPSIFLEDSDNNCVGVRLWGSYNVTRAERNWAQRVLLPYLNTAVSDAAAAAGVTYVDIFSVTKTHEVCTSDPWINGARLGDDRQSPQWLFFNTGANESFHPNQEAHENIAEFFVDRYTNGNKQLIFTNPSPRTIIRPPTGTINLFRAGSVDASLQQSCGAGCVQPAGCVTSCSIQLNMAGFKPNSTLTVTAIGVTDRPLSVESSPTRVELVPASTALGTVTTNAAGVATQTLPFPDTLGPGGYLIQAEGPIGTTGRQTGFTTMVVSRDQFEYVAVPPVRLLDTRVGPEFTTIDGTGAGGGPNPGGTVLFVKVAGRAGVPSDASAVVLNVTVTEPEAAGFATVFPCGAPRPNASNVNFVAGATVPSAVVARIGIDGNVCVFTNVGAHLVADINGFYPPRSAFVPLSPARLLDTRQGPEYTTVDGQARGSGLHPGETFELQVLGRTGVPSNPPAVELSVTITEPQAAGFATVYPCGESRPNASNLNFLPGITVANAVFAKVGTGGKVCIYTNAPAHLIADVNGYYLPATPFVPTSPTRLLDTRPSAATADGQGAGLGAAPGGVSIEVQVTGRVGVPADIAAAVLNVTATESIAAGFATVYPCGSAPPVASNVNFAPGATVANAAATKIGVGGKICVFTNVAAHIIVDLNGYYRVS